MKLSLNWLSDYVAFTETNPQKIAEALTLSVAEVEEVEEQGALLKDCCVGKVLKMEKHPNADKLSVCEVQTDRGIKKVVCGGTNLREGMLVAFAHIGARVRWHGEEMMTLERVKIRGEESEGMICAASELDLEEMFPGPGGAHIIDLTTYHLPLTTGQLLNEALNLTDTIFHIDNHSITHRADLFSHIGFARECVGIGLGTWKKDATVLAPKFAKEPIPFKFIIDHPEGMPWYVACMISIDAAGVTPDWMVRRLEATGWRSINLPIDITNYVMMECGVPLHSFDADDFKGDIHMRAAAKGEKMTTLDGIERTLNEGALVLSDDDGIFDLLGIMGGLRSSTKDSTRRIYLHSASLDPMAIRRTINATGHRTDAATVFEKGVPYVTAEQGFFRATQLFLELVPGARILSQMESVGDNGEPHPIELPMQRIQSLLGREVTEKEATDALTGLGFAVTNSAALRQAQGDTVLSVLPPLHRLGDIHEEADLIEEVARVTGFHTYASALPEASIAVPARNPRLHVLRDIFKEEGCTELVRYAFLGEELLAKAGMTADGCDVIENPIGEDMKIMRPSLLPRLLEAAAENIRRSETDLRFFEIGHVFKREDERTVLGMLFVRREKGGEATDPLLRMKAVLGRALTAIGLVMRLQETHADDAFLHPVRQADIRIGEAHVGWLFEVHPSIAKAFDLPDRVAGCEMDLDALFALSGGERTFQPIPEFPEITYDVTVPVAKGTSVAKLMEAAQKQSALLRSVVLTKIYEKGDVRNLTFRCTYGADDRTLKEEEVKPVHEQVEVLLHGG